MKHNTFFSFFAALLWPALFFAQSAITIDLKFNGDTTNISGIGVYPFEDVIVPQPLSNTVRFTFDSGIDQQFWVDVLFRTGERLNNSVLLGPGNIQLYVSVREQKLEIDSVIGSSIYDKLTAFRKAFGKIDKSDKNARKQYWMDFIRREKASGLVPMFISYYIALDENDKTMLQECISILDSTSAEVKNSFFYKDIYPKVKQLANSLKFDTQQCKFASPDSMFVQPQTAGKKYIVYDFWFTHCAPCVKDHKTLKKQISEGYELDDRIKFIGIATDENFTEWKEYLDKNQLPWDNLLINEQESPGFEQAGIMRYPTYLVVDEQEKIMARFNHLDELQNYLQQL